MRNTISSSINNLSTFTKCSFFFCHFWCCQGVFKSLMNGSSRSNLHTLPTFLSMAFLVCNKSSDGPKDSFDETEPETDGHNTKTFIFKFIVTKVYGNASHSSYVCTKVIVAVVRMSGSKNIIDFLISLTSFLLSIFFRVFLVVSGTELRP